MTGDSFSFGRYNSVDDWGLMVIAYDYLLPPKRARKITIPGRSGSYDFGAKNWEERTLRMTWYADAPSHESRVPRDHLRPQQEGSAPPLERA